MEPTKEQQDKFSSKSLKEGESDDSQTPTGKKPLTFERVHSFLLWLSLSLGFAVSYMQRLSPSTWGDNIAEEFETDAAGFGSVAASYWYFYATLQIPIGIILDLYGSWVLLIVGSCLSLVGSILFATADNLVMAGVARAMIGTGDAPLFVSILQLCGQKFPKIRSTLFGFTLFLSVSGGFIAQAPNALLTQEIGWRGAAWTLAGFEAVFLAVEIVLWLAQCSHEKKQRETKVEPATVNVAPAGTGAKKIKGPAATKPAKVAKIQPQNSVYINGKKNFGLMLKRVLFLPDNWVLVIGAFFINFAMQVYQGLWAVPYLETVYGLTTPKAAALSSMMLIGWGVMNPAWGAIADKTSHWAHNSRAILGGANLLGVVASCIMFYTPGRLPEPLVWILMFLMGASASISVLMTTTQKRNDPKVTAIATSAVNTMVTISGAVGQQGYGFLLKTMYADYIDAEPNRTIVNRTGLQYPVPVYKQASYIFPGIFLVAVFICVFGLSCPKKSEEDEKDSQSESLVSK